MGTVRAFPPQPPPRARKDVENGEVDVGTLSQNLYSLSLSLSLSRSDMHPRQGGVVQSSPLTEERRGSGNELHGENPLQSIRLENVSMLASD